MNSLKCCRSILLLQPSCTRYSLHLRYACAKPVNKEVIQIKPHSSILHKHIHHHVTFYVTQLQALSNFHGMQHFEHSSQYPQTVISVIRKRYIIQKELKPAIDAYLSTKIAEDRRYYQYHPSEAKRLALSYLQEKRVREALKHLFPRRAPLVLLHHATVRKSELDYVLRPAIYKRELEMTYAKQPSTKLVPSQVQEVITRKEVIIEKVEVDHLIRRVYHEIEKRLQQKQQKRGR